MADALTLGLVLGGFVLLLAIAGTIAGAWDAVTIPDRRCIACGRPVWPWSRQGWRVSYAGVLRWHAECDR